MTDLIHDALKQAIADTRLAEWLAIQSGKTRLEYKEHIEDARELADYLTVIGYRLEEKGVNL